jgi:hypothetical protein
VREHGIFVAGVFMDKRERKVTVYVGDCLYYRATMASEEALEETQDTIWDVLVRLEVTCPGIIVQWNSIAEYVHEFLRRFTSEDI